MKNMKVILGKIFTVEKGSRKMRWKVIKHPCFPGSYSLVRDYNGMMSYEQPADYDHLCGAVSLDDAYETAYMLT